MSPRRGPVARGAALEATAPATAGGNDGNGPLRSKDAEDFFLIAGGGANSLTRSPPADVRGVLHVDLCVRGGEPWVSRLWYEGQPSAGGAHRYAVAVHNGGFDSAEAGGAVGHDSDDESPPPRSAVGSSQKKSRARLVSSSSDEHSETPRARRRVSLGDDASDGDGAPRSGSPVVRRSQRLDDRQKRRQSSPLAERLIKRQRNGSGERRLLEASDDSDGSVEAANSRERRARRRRARRDSDDDSGSDRLSDFLVDDDDDDAEEDVKEEEEEDSASGDGAKREGGGDASPSRPPNPYLMSREELDECARPAAEQLRAVTSGRRLGQFGAFRLYMKSLLRRACRELSDRGGGRHRRAAPASLSVLPEEKEERRAACKVRDDMIQSMKNTLNSAAWHAEFKDALDKYQEYTPKRVPFDGRTCQACHRSERRATYEVTLSRPTAVAGGASSDDDDSSSANREPSPEPELVFYVGRRCANRSQGYHELQHYEQVALDACRKRVQLAAAHEDCDAVTPELCLAGKDGDEWIQLEYQLFQSQLSAAEKYMDKDADDDG